MNEKNSMWWILGIILLVFVGPPIINWMYGFEGGYLTYWGASGALGYYGSVLACLGAVFIGLVSLHQNRVFKQENDRSQAELKRINDDLFALQRDQSRGYFILDAYLLNSDGDKHYAIHNVADQLTLVNRSGRCVNALAYHVRHQGMVTKREDECRCFFMGDGDPLSKWEIETGLNAQEPQIELEKTIKLEIVLRLESETGYRYSQRLEAGFEECNGSYQLTSFNTKLSSDLDYKASLA